MQVTMWAVYSVQNVYSLSLEFCRNMWMCITSWDADKARLIFIPKESKENVIWKKVVSQYLIFVNCSHAHNIYKQNFMYFM